MTDAYFLGVSASKLLYYRKKVKKINTDITPLLMWSVNMRLFFIFYFILHQVGHLKVRDSEGNSHFY